MWEPQGSPACVLSFDPATIAQSCFKQGSSILTGPPAPELWPALPALHFLLSKMRIVLPLFIELPPDVRLHYKRVRQQIQYYSAPANG